MAVVVPMYRRSLSSDEEISCRHLLHYLDTYDRYLVSPQGLDIALNGFDMKRFSDDFFHSTATYSALLLSPEFYQAFAKYEYILIYQPDCLVFSDQLQEWCSKDLDYVGAPWFNADGADFVSDAAVGNGGFSLRRVESFLRVIDSPGFAAELDKYTDAFWAAKPWPVQLVRMPYRLRRRLGLFLPTKRDMLSKTGQVPAGERLNEDCFWSFKAEKYWPDFKIASVADGLRFSFEMAPRRCLERTGGRLPFGCHAWAKYDREFWEPFLLR